MWFPSVCGGLTKSEEGVFWVHEHQHSPEQVFIHDVGLDVIGVVLHTEGQQLQDERQELSGLEVIYKKQTNIRKKHLTFQQVPIHI